jgi:hypothetical protein
MKIPVAIKMLCLPPLCAAVAFWALSLYMVGQRIGHRLPGYGLAVCAAAVLAGALAVAVWRLRRRAASPPPPAPPVPGARGRTWPLGIFYAVLLGLLTLSACSYMTIRNACLEARALLAAVPQADRDMSGNSLRLERVRGIILHLEARLDASLLPGFWHADGQRILAALKERFCVWYAADVLSPGDAALERRLNAAISRRNAADDDFIRAYLFHLLWRLDALDTAGNPADTNARDAMAALLEELEEAGDPAPGPDEDMAVRLRDLALSCAAWSFEASDPTRTSRLYEKLDALLLLQGSDWSFAWLLGSPGQAIGPAAFWNLPEPALARAPVVAPAYTIGGRARMDRVTARMLRVFADRENIADRVSRFRREYRDRYYAQWENMVLGFDPGQAALEPARVRDAVLGRMPEFDNPYFLLIAAMRDHLAAITDLGPGPAWARMIAECAAAMDFSSRPRQPGAWFNRLRDAVRSGALTVADAVTGQPPGVRFDPERTAIALNAYLASLETLRRASSSPASAYAIAKSFYSGSYAAFGGSPVARSLAALDQLRGRLRLPAETPLFQALVRGPLSTLLAAADRQTAHLLNELWQQEVAAPAANIPSGQLWDILAGRQGIALAFAEKHVDAFVRDSRDGWTPASNAAVFPFTGEFLAFLNAARRYHEAMATAYPVIVKGRPASVSPATAGPANLLRLDLACADGVQRLDIHSHITGADFVWTPEACGSVTVSAAFDHGVLRKQWTGPFCFRTFADSFIDGRLPLSPEDFSPEDFSGDVPEVEATGMETLILRYDIAVPDDMPDESRFPPPAVPGRIARPWEAAPEDGS